MRAMTVIPGEVQRISLDPCRGREKLGWQPRVELDEGLERTLESFREDARRH